MKVGIIGHVDHGKTTLNHNFRPKLQVLASDILNGIFEGNEKESQLDNIDMRNQLLKDLTLNNTFNTSQQGKTVRKDYPTEPQLKGDSIKPRPKGHRPFVIDGQTIWALNYRNAQKRFDKNEMK